LRAGGLLTLGLLAAGLQTEGLLAEGLLAEGLLAEGLLAEGLLAAGPPPTGQITAGGGRKTSHIQHVLPKQESRTREWVGPNSCLRSRR
jgi:hypothetical protein